jgi:membrane-bound lytic murein transglycosylase D
MIRAKLCKAGLPEDLTYLALIESGYDPNAYSSAAAVGIWQLMTGTAQGTGLRVDWWIDERRDPVRSTDGAIRFLGWLNQQFGSLYLAAAAYNGGPGRVARGLKSYSDELEGQTGDDAFFALAETDYLRAETRDYVPKLIAAALVGASPCGHSHGVRQCVRGHEVHGYRRNQAH